MALEHGCLQSSFGFRWRIAIPPLLHTYISLPDVCDISLNAAQPKINYPVFLVVCHPFMFPLLISVCQWHRIAFAHCVTIANLHILVPQYTDHPWFGKFSGLAPAWPMYWQHSFVRPSIRVFVREFVSLSERSCVGPSIRVFYREICVFVRAFVCSPEHNLVRPSIRVFAREFVSLSQRSCVQAFICSFEEFMSLS